MLSLTGSDGAPPEASLLLSPDAIKQLQETAALPLTMDDSGLVLSDSAILQLGRAAVGAPEKKAPVDGPQGISPSGIMRMAAGMRLPDEGDATRADSAVAEVVSRLAESTRDPGPRPAKASTLGEAPTRPQARPMAMNQMPTALLSPIAGPPREADEMAETSIRSLPGPLTVKNSAPLPAGARPLERRPTSTGMVIVPTGGALGADIELPPEPAPGAPDLKAAERKAQVTRKSESTVLLGEPSIGAQLTGQGITGPDRHEETAIRAVFQRFGPADPREKGRPAAAAEATFNSSRSSWVSKLLIGLVAINTVGTTG